MKGQGKAADPVTPHEGGPLGSSGATPDVPAQRAPSDPTPARTEAERAAALVPAAGHALVEAATTPRAPGAPVKKRGIVRRGTHATYRGVRRSTRVTFRGLGQAGRVTADWSRRPLGRLLVPALIIVVLVVGAGTAGAYLVPTALSSAPKPTATPAFPASGGASPTPSGTAGVPSGLLNSAPGAGQEPTGVTVTTSPPAPGTVVDPAAPTTPAQTGTGVLPQAALATWATQVGTKVDVPVVAMEAYGYAELVEARNAPSCHLSWTTLAAIGEQESSNGQFGNSVLGADGKITPPIYGLPLDGKGGRQLVKDTDQGTIDGDTTYDRAVGPMQFIPSTWEQYKVDADNDGVADPNDMNDAAMTAAVYLCQGGRDLSQPGQWWDAIYSYNDVQQYAQDIFAKANNYGVLSKG